MNGQKLTLSAAPIVEAILDIDCDMAPLGDVEALNSEAGLALADQYPTQRRQVLSEHQVSITPDQPVSVASRQGLQALQYFSADERQLIQFRPAGFSFNRLAPYTSLDDYFQEIERTWKIFVAIAKPIVCRRLSLRYINRIQIPIAADSFQINEYLTLAPNLVTEKGLNFTSLFNQHSVLESATQNHANIVFATQPYEDECLPVIFDIECYRNIGLDPGDWGAISGTIQSLRDLKNRVFTNSLTEKCLNLFQS